LGIRILLDTNVWRYIVDLDSVEILNGAARDGCGQILACPAVLYEMLRFETRLFG
jgi:predicted nucleic acid-binding protein